MFDLGGLLQTGSRPGHITITSQLMHLVLNPLNLGYVLALLVLRVWAHLSSWLRITSGELQPGGRAQFTFLRSSTS